MPVMMFFSLPFPVYPDDTIWNVIVNIEPDGDKLCTYMK